MFHSILNRIVFQQKWMAKFVRVNVQRLVVGESDPINVWNVKTSFTMERA